MRLISTTRPPSRPPCPSRERPLTHKGSRHTKPARSAAQFRLDKRVLGDPFHHIVLQSAHGYVFRPYFYEKSPRLHGHGRCDEKLDAHYFCGDSPCGTSHSDWP